MIFPMKPNFITGLNPEYKVKIVEFENGLEQRQLQTSNPKKTFSLKFDYLNCAGTALSDFSTRTEKIEYLHANYNLNTLLGFYDVCKGSLSGFNFENHIDGKTYYCRFSENAMQISYIKGMWADVTLELITC